MNELCNEILFFIFSHVKRLVDCNSVSIICHHWNNIIDNNYFWENKLSLNNTQSNLVDKKYHYSLIQDCGCNIQLANFEFLVKGITVISADYFNNCLFYIDSNLNLSLIGNPDYNENNVCYINCNVTKILQYDIVNLLYVSYKGLYMFNIMKNKSTLIIERENIRYLEYDNKKRYIIIIANNCCYFYGCLFREWNKVKHFDGIKRVSTWENDMFILLKEDSTVFFIDLKLQIVQYTFDEEINNHLLNNKVVDIDHVIIFEKSVILSNCCDFTYYYNLIVTGNIIKNVKLDYQTYYLTYDDDTGNLYKIRDNDIEHYCSNVKQITGNQPNDILIVS